MFILLWIYPPNPGCQWPSNTSIITFFSAGSQPGWKPCHDETILGGWDRSQPFNQKHPPGQLTAGTPKLVVWRCFSFSKEIFSDSKCWFSRGLYHLTPPSRMEKNMASSKRVSRPASTFPTLFPAQGNKALFMWQTKREQEPKPGRYQTWCFVAYVSLNIPIWGIYMWES